MKDIIYYIDTSILGVGKIAKNVLSVMKFNKNGTLIVVIPAQFARDLGITEESFLTCSKVGNSLHYNRVLIE